MAFGLVYAGSGKQLVQRDVVPVPHDLVQLSFQLTGALHVQAGQQRGTAAQHLGNGGQGFHHGSSAVHEKRAEPHEQEDRTAQSAQKGQEIVALLGVLLFPGGDVGTINGLTIRSGAGSGLPGCGSPAIPGLLFLFGFFIDAFQDEQQKAQWPRNGKCDEDGNGGDVRKIMLFRLHGTSIPFTRKNKDRVPLYYSGPRSFC